MAKPLISVIVPVYNTEKYLRRCLNSLINQTYTNIEIICINDGSTDNSLAIAEEYAADDQRIKIISQKNAGLATARNIGLSHATGEWIAAIDSDDWIEADTYEYFYKNLPDSDIKLAVLGIEHIDYDTGKKIWVDRLPKKGVCDLTPELIEKTRAYFWNKIWHRSLFHGGKIEFPAGFWFEDAAMWYMIAPYQTRILYLPDIKYHYIRYANTISIMSKSRARDKKNIDLVLIPELIFKYHHEHPLPHNMQIVDKWFLERYYSIYIQYYNHINQEKVWQKYREIVEKYHLLDDIYSSPKLALWYYLPPSTVDAIFKVFATKNSLNNNDYKLSANSNNLTEIDLLINKEMILQLYRRTKLKYYFSFGARKEKYKQRLKKLYTYVRRYRDFKLSSEKKLKHLIKSR